MTFICSFGVALNEKSNNFVHYNDKLFNYFSTGTVGDYYVCKETFTLIRVQYDDDDVKINWICQVSKVEYEWNPDAISIDKSFDGRTLNVTVKLNQ